MTLLIGVALVGILGWLLLTQFIQPRIDNLVADGVRDGVRAAFQDRIAADLGGATTGEVTITGDFNRNHFKVFGNKVAYDSGLRAGTHGSATLDYVMHTRHEALQKLSNRVDSKFASDHNAVIVRYDLD